MTILQTVLLALTPFTLFGLICFFVPTLRFLSRMLYVFWFDDEPHKK